MTKTFLSVSVFLFLLGVVGSKKAQAQAWTQPQGGAYVKTSFGTTLASHQFNFDGRIKQYAEGIDENTFKVHSIMLYAEGGVFDFLTLSLAVPFQMVTIFDRTFQYETHDWSDIVLGLRLSLKQIFNIKLSSFAFAINVQSAIPTGYRRNLQPSVGMGLADIRSSLNIGYSFYPLPIYIQGGVGYRYRIPTFVASVAEDCKTKTVGCIEDSTAPPDTHELKFVLEVGFSVKGWLLIQLLGDAAISLRKPAVAFSIANPLPADQRLIKGGLATTVYPFKPFKHLKKLGLGVQVMFALYGENAIRSLEIFVGLEYGLNFAKLFGKKK